MLESFFASVISVILAWQHKVNIYLYDLWGPQGNTLCPPSSCINIAS